MPRLKHKNFNSFWIFLGFVLFSCSHTNQHIKKVESSDPKNISMIITDANKQYYLENASDAEVFDEVVELEDEFQSSLSPEDNKLLKEILESNTVDLKFGAKYDLPMEINPQVVFFIRYFQTRGRKHFEKWLERGKWAIPFIRSKLKEQNMPEDLVFVAMIESGFSPRAYSRARAVGPWQFIRSTGKRMGLKINWWIDERRSWEKSTYAAIKHFKQLYKRFDNWYLSIAAYNAGEGKISRAIKKYGTKDYWELVKYRYIREETKNYVPKMIAAALIVKNLEAYGFAPIVHNNEDNIKKVTIKEPTDLFKISKHTGLSYKLIKSLNPELRRWTTPPNTKNYLLNLPSSISNAQIASLEKNIKTDPLRFKRHRVRRGETLWSIANRYKVTTTQLKRMNNLVRSRYLRVGQILVLPVPNSKAVKNQQRPIMHKQKIVKTNYVRGKRDPFSKAKYYSVKRGDTLWDIASRFQTSPQLIKDHNPKVKNRGGKILLGESIIIPYKKERGTESLPVYSKQIVHEVQAGENLYLIARRYNTSVSNLLEKNNISEETVIKPGDKLKIK